MFFLAQKTAEDERGKAFGCNLLCNSCSNRGCFPTPEDKLIVQQQIVMGPNEMVCKNGELPSLRVVFSRTGAPSLSIVEIYFFCGSHSVFGQR